MTYHHLSVLIHRQAEKYGDKVALKYRDYEHHNGYLSLGINSLVQYVRQPMRWWL